ncbi:stage II sporulation protein P [Brevibacillus thermoruber]|uniref:stage II sporulation protein P n=1 Tax=Brevibacillus thermoruber TaxID=33942 RepID=UPI004042D360
MVTIKKHLYLLSIAFGFFFAFADSFFHENNSFLMIRQSLHSFQRTPTVEALTTKLSQGQEIAKAFLQQNPKITQLLFGLPAGINISDLYTILVQELPGASAKHIIESTILKDQNMNSSITLRNEKHTVRRYDNDKKHSEGLKSTSPPPLFPKSNKKIAFVYHTHNRESWLSVVDPSPQTESVEHPTKNITLIGRHLAEALNDKGVGTIVNTDDFYQKLLDQGKSYVDSYEESLRAIKTTKQKYKDLRFFIDLHRDDKPREKTTILINGKSYARVFFVIGNSSKRRNENAQFATKLHEIMEKKYPGLSRGIVEKNEAGGNGEYNQSVSPESVLLEIGGIENTIQEGYNTADALVEVLFDYYFIYQKSDSIPTVS